jgi:hypothetical protein
MIAISAYYKVQAQVDDLQRQLDNARTGWLCETCDGRACEGQRQSELMFAENEKLRADKQRLDWLQNSNYWPHPPLGEDIRAAIDAARKEKP